MVELKFRIMSKRYDNIWIKNEHTLRYLIEMDGNGFLDDDDIIEQYTGLKDKNGKEIYEGDILLIPRTKACSSAKMYQVIWYHTQARFKFVDICGEMDNINIGKIKRSEVIGNIHENPELL